MILLWLACHAPCPDLGPMALVYPPPGADAVPVDVNPVFAPAPLGYLEGATLVDADDVEVFADYVPLGYVRGSLIQVRPWEPLEPERDYRLVGATIDGPFEMTNFHTGDGARPTRGVFTVADVKPCGSGKWPDHVLTFDVDGDVAFVQWVQDAGPPPTLVTPVDVVDVEAWVIGCDGTITDRAIFAVK